MCCYGGVGLGPGRVWELGPVSLTALTAVFLATQAPKLKCKPDVADSKRGEKWTTAG